ncbi:unnamed protein product [Phytomonas sp. Hart1]|nr:unnamed protein product [Phytomonas sp. Hart1]|eukprot:CCW71968.1 unnamed protein product [Phytomonas sp. isolate Hart1]
MTKEHLHHNHHAPPSVEDVKQNAYDERLRVNLSAIDASGPVTGGFARAYAAVIPRGGLAASTFSLVSAILGAGIVVMPFAFNLCGIVMALVILNFVAISTVYAMRLLAEVAHQTGARSYSEAARQLMGPGVDHFIAVLLIIICFGGSVMYIITVQGLLKPVLSRPNSPAWLRSSSGVKFMTTMVWLFIMVPLSIPKQINSLRYVSLIGVLVIVYFVGVIVFHSVTHGLKNPDIRKEIVLVRTGNAALEGLGIFMFMFLCQINAFEVFHEMKTKTVSNFTLYSTISVIFCALLYVISGLFGYMDFGKNIVVCILELYDPINDPSVAVAFIGLIVKICVAFVLHMIPFRNAIYHFLRLDPMEVPYLKHTLVVMFPLTLSLLSGLFFPKLNTVMGLTGAFCGGILGMIMPALYYMYCGNFSYRKVGYFNFLGTYLLLISGCAAVSFGTVMTVYGTF